MALGHISDPPGSLARNQPLYSDTFINRRLRVCSLFSLFQYTSSAFLNAVTHLGIKSSVPILVCLVLRDGDSGWEWHPISAEGAPSAVPTLKSFSLSFGQQERCEDRVDLKQREKDVDITLERLRQLRSQGLQLDIQSSLKWFGTSIDSQMIEEISS
ncbi:hypothetical protein C8R43DRAFT_1119677 [Mycena crocata]|nr:hypothetical protein C8R43DRAFT_1119677 [Mycena crocata]